MTAVRPLFARYHELRAVLDSVLEGRLGRIEVDDPGQPRVARLSLGCYEILGGDPDAPGARRLATDVKPPCELIYGNEPAWRRLLLSVHESRVEDRPMRSFDPTALDRRHLESIVGSCPSGFEVVPLDARWLAQVDDQLVPHGLQTYPSAEAILADGFGVGVSHGDELAAVATSYATSTRRVEVAIATRPAYRARGLAAVAGAGFLLEARARGLEPAWNASNPVSQRLALRLGFLAGGVCEVLYLR